MKLRKWASRTTIYKDWQKRWDKLNKNKTPNLKTKTKQKKPNKPGTQVVTSIVLSKEGQLHIFLHDLSVITVTKMGRTTYQV